MPHWDATISLGSVLSTLIFIGGAFIASAVFKTRVELLIQKHQELLTALSSRLSHHEERDELLFREMQARITDLVGVVQRLVGQYEVFRVTGGDRRQP